MLAEAIVVVVVVYYGPSIISVTVTKGGYLRGNRLYKTSKTIRQGVTELYNKNLIYAGSRNIKTLYI